MGIMIRSRSLISDASSSLIIIPTVILYCSDFSLERDLVRKILSPRQRNSRPCRRIQHSGLVVDARPNKTLILETMVPGIGKTVTQHTNEMRIRVLL
jgi:hypothetical protein